MPNVGWGFMEMMSMRRHGELRVADGRSGRRAASWRALAALGLFVTATGTIHWGGAVPGAFAAVSPDTGAISDGAASVASGASHVIVQPIDDRRTIPLKQQDAE